jgi:hypothetical protein
MVVKEKGDNAHSDNNKISSPREFDKKKLLHKMNMKHNTGIPCFVQNQI